MESQTNKKIQDVMELFKNWGLLKTLTDGEVENIRINLSQIAGTAVIEANNKIQNILPSFYHELVN